MISGDVENFVELLSEGNKACNNNKNKYYNFSIL